MCDIIEGLSSSPHTVCVSTSIIVSLKQNLPKANFLLSSVNQTSSDYSFPRRRHIYPAPPTLQPSLTLHYHSLPSAICPFIGSYAHTTVGEHKHKRFLDMFFFSFLLSIHYPRLYPLFCHCFYIKRLYETVCLHL